MSGHNNVSRQTSSEDKENSGDDQMKELTAKNEKISVKERTKTFNRMASEVNSLTSRVTSKKRKHIYTK